MAEVTPQEMEFDIRRYVESVLRRKWLVIGFTAAVTIAVGIGTAMQPRVYESRASVLAGRDSPRLLKFDDPLAQEGFREPNYLQTQTAILTSRSFLQGAGKRLIAAGFYGKIPPAQVEAKSWGVAKELQGQLQIQTTPNSRVIQIIVRGYNPEKITLKANAIAEEYASSNLVNKEEMASQAISWLESKLTEQRTKLTVAESALQAFKEKERILGDDDDPFSTLNLTRLNDEYLTTRFQRMERETRLAALKRGARSRSSSGTPSATRALDAQIQSAVREALKKDYVDAQLQLRDLSQRYGSEHPDIITLQGKVSRIANELESLEQPEPAGTSEGEAAVSEDRIADLQAEYTVLLNKEKALANTLEAQKASARNFSRTAVRYSLLKQDVDLNQQTYNSLLTRLNEAKLSSQIKSSTVMVLDRAELPDGPISPKPVQNLIMAVVLGLALGIGVVVLMEIFDRRVKSPEDAARYLRLPLLAVVPGVGSGKKEGRTEGKPQLVTYQQPRSHAAECYRNLRTSILFSSGRPVPKTILVTSTVAGEGKSTTVSNLAVVMAQTGRKVLLVEADLRRPSLQRFFVRQANRGLMRLLNDGCRPEEAIQESGIENLDLLLCHGIPPNPSELLGSERMVNVIEQLKARYDVVLIDSPVVVSVPDAVILASRAEAVVFVHRPGATDRDMVRHAREKLEEVKANVLGLVMNNVDVKTGKYLYPEYLYYGYGVEEDGKAEKRRKKRS